MDKFLDKVVSYSTKDKEAINRVYRGVLKAVQQDAFGYNGEKFHLLEGTVQRTKNGLYIFTPNKHLAELLSKKDEPYLLKMEESRFADLIKLALSEVQD